MTEKGSDEMLPADYDPSAQLAADAAALDAEDARVEAVDPEPDPGVDYPAPEPPEDDADTGFDPLP
jgi:hypothetical protein